MFDTAPMLRSAQYRHVSLGDVFVIALCTEQNVRYIHLFRNTVQQTQKHTHTNDKHGKKIKREIKKLKYKIKT